MTLHLENITKNFPTPDGPKSVLKNISATIESGTITALIGPSGGGKTTLLRLLNRLDDPSSGRILIDDRSSTAYDPLELRRKVALVPQKPVVFPGTVRDNLLAPPRALRLPLPTEQQLREVLDRCQLDNGLLAQNANTLSVGQQQRLCLARALLLEPEILLLDEPTGALDRRGADRLADELISNGLTIVMVSHDLRLSERIAQQVLFLENGELVESGPAATIFHHPQTAALKSFLATPSREQVTNDS